MVNKVKVLVVFAVILSFMIPGTALAKEFPDVSAGHWGQREIQDMANLGFIAGTPDGNFYPDNSVTRAEFAAMIVKSLKLPLNPVKKSTFKDVDIKHWARGVIDAAGKAGYIVGNQGFFRPDDRISRQEMGAIIMKISEKHGYPGDGSVAFLGQYKDYNQVSAWAAPALSAAAKFGYLEEVDNRIFAPLSQATRAQAAVGIYRVLKKVGKI